MSMWGNQQLPVVALGTFETGKNFEGGVTGELISKEIATKMELTHEGSN